MYCDGADDIIVEKFVINGKTRISKGFYQYAREKNENKERKRTYFKK